jgi:hypothetical protein
MPNRIIKESCRSSPTLEQLSDFAERLFWRLVTVADDFGCFPADPRHLRSECFPLRDTLKTIKVEEAYNELLACQLVTAYASNGRTYGQFTSWEKHNRRRASNPKYPLPTSDNICQQVTADSAESSKISRSEKRDTISCPAEAGQGEFESFWNAYPKKQAKGDAEKAWKQVARERPPIEEILSALDFQRGSEQWTKDSGQWIPLPAGWLRKKRWTDEVNGSGRDDYIPETFDEFMRQKEEKRSRGEH